MEKRKTLEKAVYKVLSGSSESMRAPEIWDEIVRDEGVDNTEMVTPITQVSGWLSDGSRGDNPPYERVSHGLYRINPNHDPEKGDTEQPNQSKTPDDIRLIQAFGMF